MVVIYISKYFTLANWKKIMLTFILYILIAQCLSTSVIECTQLTGFAPAKAPLNSLYCGFKPGPLCNINNIQHIYDLKPIINVSLDSSKSSYSTISKENIELLDNQTLFSWVKHLHTDIPNKLGGFINVDNRVEYDRQAHFNFYGREYNVNQDKYVGNTFSEEVNKFNKNFVIEPNVAHVPRDFIISTLRDRGFTVVLDSKVNIS